MLAKNISEKFSLQLYSLHFSAQFSLFEIFSLKESSKYLINRRSIFGKISFENDIF